MTITPPLAVGESLDVRISHAVVAHRDAQEVADKASRRLNGLVAEAIDQGMSYGALAKIVGVSRARIHHIVVQESSR